MGRLVRGGVPTLPPRQEINHGREKFTSQWETPSKRSCFRGMDPARGETQDFFILCPSRAPSPLTGGFWARTLPRATPKAFYSLRFIYFYFMGMYVLLVCVWPLQICLVPREAQRRRWVLWNGGHVVGET